MNFNFSCFRLSIFLLLVSFSGSLLAETLPSTPEIIDGKYQISNLAELRWVSETPDSWDKDFVLIADIDASETSSWNPTGVPDEYLGFSPIGTNFSLPFTGTFVNKGLFTIDALFINRLSQYYVGLFGVINEASLRGIIIDGIDLRGKREVGALVGSSVSSIITKCNTSGVILSTSIVAGGLIGKNYKTSVEDCSTSVDLFSEGSVGGLIGVHTIGDITNCFSSGVIETNGSDAGGLIGSLTSAKVIGSTSSTTIDAFHYVGGLVGKTSNSTIINCFSTGDITATNRAGGLIGSNNSSTLWFCYSTGNVSVETFNAGGLVGSNSSSTVLDCFSTSEVSALSHNAGGLIGNNSTSTVLNSYSTGRVSALSHNAGGLIGFYSSGEISGNFYDVETSETNIDTGNLTSLDGIMGLSTTLMQQESTFTDEGWDFSGSWVMSKTYPVLIGNTGVAPIEPSIVDGNYYISNLAELRWVSENSDYWDKSFIITSDIDASETRRWNSGLGFLPIGNAVKDFTGSFKNKGAFEVSNLYIARPTQLYVGFFGKASNATLENIFLRNVKVVGSSSVGGLVGYSDTSIIRSCFSKGSIEGESYVGGFIGRNLGSDITNCYSRGKVSGEDHEGGFVGYNNNSSSISNSYAACQIDGGSESGGFIGVHAAGGVLQNNFFDIEIAKTLIDSSNILDLEDVVGLDSSSMKIELTFNEAGWDTEFLWQVSNDYPELTGFIGVGASMPEIIDGKYQISNLAELRWVSENSDSWDKDFLITANIDASETQGWNDNKGFSPIGNTTIKFTGSFRNKEKFVISNLFINRPLESKVGLFGYTSGAEIIDLLLEAVDITGYGCGALVGWANTTSIRDSSSTGTITGTHRVGGLVAYSNFSTIINSSSSVTANAGSTVGGLVGENNQSSEIHYSSSAGDISCTSDYAGGLVGLNSNNSTVSTSYAAGNVTTTGNFAGGLIGSNDNNSLVEYSSSSGAVLGRWYVGGLVGICKSSEIRKSYSNGSSEGINYIGGLSGRISFSQVIMSYSTGDVKGEEYIGGLVGINTNSSRVLNAYASGDVDASSYAGGLVGYCSLSSEISESYANNSVSGVSVLGALVGYRSNCEISKSYFDNSIVANPQDGVGNGSSTGVEGKSSSDLMSMSTFDSWDFINVWGIIENQIKPYFLWQTEQKLDAGSVDSELNTFTFLLSEDYSNLDDYELSLDRGLSWQTVNGFVTNGQVTVDVSDEYYDVNDVFVRIKELSNGFASVGIRNQSRFLISNSSSPTRGVVDDNNGFDTFTFETAEGFTASQHEYSLDGGATWQQSSSNVIQVGFKNVDAGDLQIRLIEYESDILSNDQPFTFTETLAASSFASGDGTELSPFEINSLGDLRLLSESSFYLRNHFILTTDIDATETEAWNDGLGFLPIGFDWNNSFSGSFRNNGGFRISNLVINRPDTDYVGFFGLIDSAVIENVGLENISVTGRNSVGSIVGSFGFSSISGCYATGRVIGLNNPNASTGGYNIGGLIGYNYNGQIQNCFSNVEVSGYHETGGLVGISVDGTISNSYSSGLVSASDLFGAFLGASYSTVISGCYFDNSLLGGPVLGVGSGDSLGVEGKTAAELMIQDTYVGWDFNNFWYIPSNDYPQLRAFPLTVTISPIDNLDIVFDEDAFLDVGFTFTVNAASGYFVTSIVVNGQVFSVEGASSVTHTIDTVSGDLEISANVELVQPKPFTGLVENLSDQWKTVELPQHYINPVLVTTLITTESSTPVVTRVTNVTGNSFDIKVQRADTSIESLGQFSATYFVVEEGAFNESDHGIKLEAFLYDSHATAGKNNWVADSITPVNTFNSPVLYGQVMSNNDENWSAFFSYGSSRTQPVSSNQYNIGKHIGEDVLTSRNSETLGCIIAESGVWELDDMKFTFSLSSDTVDGIDNEGVELAVNHGNLSIVTINGVDGGDGGWAVFLNSANTSSGKVKCAIDEDIIGDSERAHTTEQVSILSAEVNAEPKLNTGVIDFVNHEWQTIELPETYTSMVVLVTPVYDSSSVPLVARVKNAVGNSFDVRMQRVDGLDTPVEAVKITYLVAEEGVYTEVEHGISMEAVKYKSTITDNTKSWIGEERTLFNTYNSPVVLGQVMSSNDDRWSAFWSRGVSRTDAPSTVLYTGKHVAQDVDKSRSEETVSYVVFESGSYEVNSLTYTIGLGSDSITGMDNSGTYYNVDCSYAVLSQSGMDGSDGSWAVLNGLEGSTDGSLNIVVDEDTIGDGERQHITEQVAYILVNP